MKLTLLTTALAAALTVVSVPALAQTAAPAATSTSTTTTTSTKMAVKKIPYKGTLTAVDAAANSITVKGAKGDMTLAVTADTKFKGGKALSDFAVGDKVTGSYSKDDAGALTACSVHKKK